MKMLLFLPIGSLRRLSFAAGPARMICCLTSLLLLCVTLSAQSILVRGRITNNQGGPIAGASILVKGAATGVTSNDNGDFQINAPSNGTLVISMINYTTREIAVNGQATLNLTLQLSDAQLQDVVVIGYGTQRKVDVTGSVARVNLEAFQDAPNTNIAQYLQGSVPGLNVGLSTFAGGTPPISIRGRVSLSGNQNVLIILDGIQYTGSLSSINPEDIASIDVLKDASSTAVYGAQAANGVILISSKKGRLNQKPRVAFSSSYTSQKPTVGDLRPYNRAEYLEALKDAFYKDAFLAPDYTQPNPNFNLAAVVDATMANASRTELLPNNYDWWGAGTNTGSILENNLSLSGGGDKVSYLLSGGLVDQKGFIINDRFKRKSIRANLEIRPLDWWKVGLISSASFVNQDGAEPALGTLQHSSPLLVPFDSLGNLIPYPTNTVDPNPFLTYYVDDYERHNYYFANIYTEIDFPFLKGLSYRLNFGNNYRTDEHFYASKYDANLTGSAYKNYQDYYDYTFDNIVTYARQFGQHDVSATLLYGAVERKFNSTNSSGTGFTRLTLSYNDLALASNQFASSDAWKESLNYQMARVNYKFRERYLLTGTIRRDGFSGFARNFKYGVFPTVAAGWIISQEPFMQKQSLVDFLKFRVGYGESGNQTSRYSSIASISTSAAYVFGDGAGTAFGQQVATLGNDNLKWERTRGLNVGVDFAMLHNRLSGSLDFYNNNTYDLLFSVKIPTTTGFDSINTNLGQIRNTGFEAAVTYKIIEQHAFNWSATLNFSTNKNKIISLTGVDANGDGKEDDLVSSGLFIGRSIGTVYDYQADGIYQIGETRLPGFQEGTYRVVDYTKDGDITSDDRNFLGRTEPAYRISLYNSLSYKGFTLSFFINSVQGGREGYLGNNIPYGFDGFRMYYRDDNSIRWNDLKGIDYWSPRNPNGKYPRNITGSHSKVEPNLWEDRSFIRLQDVSLSYKLGTGIIRRIKAQAISFYISSKNLATWTNWTGWDPETGQGVLIGGRPVLRAFTFGLNITY